MTQGNEDWKWYVGSSEDEYHTTCDSEQEARQIAATEYDGAYICEARKDHLILSTYFEADDFLEETEGKLEDFTSEDCAPIFDLNSDQLLDLNKMVRATINEWEAKHKLTFVPWKFTEFREVSYVNPNSQT